MGFDEEFSSDPGRPRGRTSSAVLLGLVIGLLAMSPGVVLYYWGFAPLVPLVLAALVAVGGRSRRWISIAEGMLAAAVFGGVFVFSEFVILATIQHR